MRLREHVTVQLFGWLVAVQSSSRTGNDERLLELVEDEGRNRAWRRFQKQRWTVTVRFRERAERVVVATDEPVTSPTEHRCEPLPRAYDAAADATIDAYGRMRRDVAGYEPSRGMRALAGMHVGFATNSVLRASRWRHHVLMDHEGIDAIGDADDPREQAEPAVAPVQAEIARAIEIVADDRVLAQIIWLRWACPRWDWQEIADELERRGHPITAGAARQKLSRVARRKIKKYATTLDHTLMEQLQSYTPPLRPGDGEPTPARLGGGPAVGDGPAEAAREREQACERLRELALGPRLTYLAIVIWAHDEDLQVAVDALWEQHGYRLRTDELVQRRKAVLGPLTREQRVALRRAARGHPRVGPDRRRLVSLAPSRHRVTPPRRSRDHDVA